MPRACEAIRLPAPSGYLGDTAAELQGEFGELEDAVHGGKET